MVGRIGDATHIDKDKRQPGMYEFDIGDIALGDVILPNGFVGGRTMYTPIGEHWDDDEDAELCDACQGAGCSFC